MADIQQAKDQLSEDAEIICPRRSARQQQNRRSDQPQVEPEQDEDIEDINEQIHVRF